MYNPLSSHPVYNLVLRFFMLQKLKEIQLLNSNDYEVTSPQHQELKDLISKNLFSNYSCDKKSSEKNNSEVLDIEENAFRLGLNVFKDWKPFKTKEANIQVIDFFSGCGGTSLGFAALGKVLGAFQLIGAVDINKVSLSSYSTNYKVDTHQISVRDLADSSEKLNSFLGNLKDYDPKKKTVLIGCAPCQGFSAHRKKDWDNPDNRNDLVEKFADIVSFILPDCVVMENVPELITSPRYKQHFDYLIKKLIKSGYTIKYEVHNSAEFGVPQERRRAIIIAMKHDFKLPNSKLVEADFLTVKDAIYNLEPLAAGHQSLLDKYHKSATHRQSTIDVIKAVPKDGGNRPKDVGPKCLQKVKGFSDVYSRLAWRKPAITITHYARNPASGRFVHPEQDRGLTMREAARLQSFPDGFIFEGGFDDVFRQIGEAVPPLLSLAIAASIYAQL